MEGLTAKNFAEEGYFFSNGNPADASGYSDGNSGSTVRGLLAKAQRNLF
jgi:hypothetical protein